MGGVLRDRQCLQIGNGVASLPVKTKDRKVHWGQVSNGLFCSACFLWPQSRERPGYPPCEIGSQARLGRHPLPMDQQQLVGLPVSFPRVRGSLPFLPYASCNVVQRADGCAEVAESRYKMNIRRRDRDEDTVVYNAQTINYSTSPPFSFLLT